MKKNLQVMTFMSWDNKIYNEKVRAVALCASDGFFYAAINCMRDDDMGKRYDDGVYERKLWGDYIQNGEHKNLRPATKEEVSLYLDHVSMREAIGDIYDLDSNIVVTDIRRDYGEYFSSVVVELKTKGFWKTIIDRLK